MSPPPHSRESAERGRRRRQLVVRPVGGAADGLVPLAFTPPEQAFVLPLRGPATESREHVDPSMPRQHKPLNLDTKSQSAQFPAINDIAVEITESRDSTKSRRHDDAPAGDFPALGPEKASYGGGLSHA